MKEYNRANIPLAKSLRNNMTPWERKLWFCFLKEHHERFYKQKAIGNYIVDFYCAKAALVIELDGSQHFEGEHEKEDTKRTEALNEMGLSVLRISNHDVDKNFRGVCDFINLTLAEQLRSR